MTTKYVIYARCEDGTVYLKNGPSRVWVDSKIDATHYLTMITASRAANKQKDDCAKAGYYIKGVVEYDDSPLTEDQQNEVLDALYQQAADMKPSEIVDMIIEGWSDDDFKREYETIQRD